MSFTQGARASIATRQRTRELSGDVRAGAWSRRQVRTLQRTWLRKHHRIIASLVVGVALAVGGIEALAPASTRNYLVGAFGWTIDFLRR